MQMATCVGAGLGKVYREGPAQEAGEAGEAGEAEEEGQATS